jgi:CheY-like chemotaxis protein
MNSQPPPLPPQGKKILIVDDDAVVVKALSLKLSSKGYQIVSALDPSGAVQAVREHKPNLILLDVNFPPDVGGVAWDGFRIVQWLRRLDDSRRIPVIIITGSDLAKFKARSDEIGAAAMFHKPIDNDELLDTVQKVMAEWEAKSKSA